MRFHRPARDHVAMDWAPALYVIRVDGQLGAMTLWARLGRSSRLLARSRRPGMLLSALYQFANLQYLAARPTLAAQAATTFYGPITCETLGA